MLNVGRSWAWPNSSPGWVGEGAVYRWKGGYGLPVSACNGPVGAQRPRKALPPRPHGAMGTHAGRAAPCTAGGGAEVDGAPPVSPVLRRTARQRSPFPRPRAGRGQRGGRAAKAATRSPKRCPSGTTSAARKAPPGDSENNSPPVTPPPTKRAPSWDARGRHAALAKGTSHSSAETSYPR